VDECILASVTYERDYCKFVGISETVKCADKTKTVKIKTTLNSLLSNSNY
jgi:hypothetical protein